MGYQMRSASAVSSFAGQRALGVQQDEVVVAERPGVAAADAADRGERDPLELRSTGRGLPHLGEPVPVEGGERRPAGRAGTRDGEVAGAGQVEPPGADLTRGGGHAQMASTPRSPVRTRATSSTGIDPDLAVTDAAGLRGLEDDVHDRRRVHVVDEHLDAALRHEVDGVLGTAVDLAVTALATVAVRLADRHALDAEGLEGLLHLVELVGLDDGGDELHDLAPSRFLESERRGVLRRSWEHPRGHRRRPGRRRTRRARPGRCRRPRRPRGSRQPMVDLSARAMTRVTTPEMTMVHRAIRTWMTVWSMPPP